MSKVGYPVWWDSTVTIYNKYVDKQTDITTWYRTVVTDCFWKNVSDKLTIGQTVLETNNIICRIPKDERYLPKDKWILVPSDSKSSYFTLGVGDIIINGEVTDDINEYLSGHRSTDVIAKYKELQGCMEVTVASDNTGIGRCEEHYYAKGI